MIRILDAGESHGQAMTVIIDGIPAGLEIHAELINRDLARRQSGAGRGGRMAIEKDMVRILSGIRHGKSLGSPVSLLVENHDHANWGEIMSTEKTGRKSTPLTMPRPGHADLAGMWKYGQKDMRNILERSSARNTTTRVAAGAVCKALLAKLGIVVTGLVTRIGKASAKQPIGDPLFASHDAEKSPVRCHDDAAARRMIKAIGQAKKAGDSLGGIFEVHITGVLPGLGSCMQWDRRLDSRLGAAFMGIPAIKGVEIGDGFMSAQQAGSEVHDPIMLEKGKITRPSNHAGGLEGGMTNGRNIVIRAAMKPIPTLMRPLSSVDMATGKPVNAARERSDTCAVPAAAVVGEAVAAIELARAVLEKFSADTMRDLSRSFKSYRQNLLYGP